MVRDLGLMLNEKSVDLRPGVREDGVRVLVPVLKFCGRIGAEVEERGGQMVVCLDELCIPLLEREEIDGTIFVDIDDLADPLKLGWSIDGDTLKVRQSMKAQSTGLGIGQRPPAFELPDLRTGKLVSIHDFVGKKTIFFMWASW